MKLMRALIIDPDSQSRMHVSRLLEECAFQCVEATDGLDALRFISDFAIDLIVTEVSLQRLNIVSLLHIIRGGAFGRLPPPLIICSARLHEASWITHPALQGLTLLEKPFTPDAFALALDNAFVEYTIDAPH